MPKRSPSVVPAASHPLAQEILIGMPDWRSQHPKATLREMEDELDRRWARVRARMLEDLALESAAAHWQDRPSAEHPRCLHCGGDLQSRGDNDRILQTHGGQDLTLTRSYAWCPTCQVGLFPPG